MEWAGDLTLKIEVSVNRIGTAMNAQRAQADCRATSPSFLKLQHNLELIGLSALSELDETGPFFLAGRRSPH
jgi:hypothetical protein